MPPTPDPIGASALGGLIRQLARAAGLTIAGSRNATQGPVASPGTVPAPSTRPKPTRPPAVRRGRTRRGPEAPNRRGANPGDFTGVAPIEYAPIPDSKPDPGEIVWTWVAFEDDPSRGKDRPVLVIGRDGAWLLALMLTSKDHERDASEEAAAGRHWFDIGAGPWDSKGRPSEIRLDRILRIDPQVVRREGATLERARFEQVADAVRIVHGW